MSVQNQKTGASRSAEAKERRIRPQRASYPRTKELSGVVVVVTARDRRAAVARCLEGLRDSHEHCADIVYVDALSADRSALMVRERFPFARVVPEFEDAIRAVQHDAAPPRFVVVVSPDVSLDRLALRALVRAAAAAPEGEAVAPTLEDPGGNALDTDTGASIDPADCRRSAPPDVPVWAARRRELARGKTLSVRVLSDVRALVPRPAELSQQLPSRSS